MRGRLAAVAAIIVTSLVAAGCGGDDETLTAAQVREQGNAACLKLSKRLGRLSGDDIRNDPQATGREAGAALNEAIETIRALHGPEEVQRQVDRFLTLYDEGVDLTTQMANPSMPDEKKGELQERISEKSDEIGRAARAAGFTACAEL